MSKLSIKYFQVILFGCFLFLFNTLDATVRYVSKTGSSTPPYTTWATAADSIQKCIDVSVFGDSIFVASGIYKEKVVMTKGLSLIGSGMDSCYIDTRDIAVPQGFYSVLMADTCQIKGFNISVSGADFGVAVGVLFYKVGCIIEENTFTDGFAGCRIVSSEAIIRNNIIKNMSNRGLSLSAPEIEYNQLIHDNLITNFENSGIVINAGANGVIRNNIIFLNRPTSSAFFTSLSYGLQKISNIIIADTGGYGISSSYFQPMQDLNNTVVGGFNYAAITIGTGNDARNNIVVSSGVGIRVENGNPVIKYNNVWNNKVNYVNHTPDSTNISFDPMFVDEENWDFHLQMFSPLIDAGDPSILDLDGSRSDIGAFGGPYGDISLYPDLPPSIPRGILSEINSDTLNVRWKFNTENDFSHYNVYRDTTSGFSPDSTNLIFTADTSLFMDIIKENKNQYYKITAIDSQSNESEPGEEIAVIVTALDDKEIKVPEDYSLYQNYPNPFNPSTKIGFKMKDGGYARLVVYDIKGELIAELVNGYKTRGYHEAEFWGRENKDVSKIASGIYLYRIEIKNEKGIPVFGDMKKMVFIK